MPVIRILGQDREVVYEGEGDLIFWTDTDQPGLHPRRIALRQEQTRPTERRCRELDLTEFLRVFGSEWRILYGCPEPIISLDWVVPEEGLQVPVPDIHRISELVIQLPAVELSWLADILNQSFETPEERRRVAEARREMYRSAPVSWDVRRLGLRDIVDAMDSLGLAAQGAGFLGQALQQAAEAEDELNRQATLPRLQGLAERRNEYPWLTAEAFGLPVDPIRPDPAHDELIASVRSEFPHDPYQYGRIYPGDIGTSRWTPPEDPDEKIRSCP